MKNNKEKTIYANIEAFMIGFLTGFLTGLINAPLVIGLYSFVH